MSKQEVFGNFRSGATKITRMEIDDLSVREHGDAAIMTYRTLTTISEHGTVVDDTVRSTAIYLRREGLWKLAAQQQTSIADGAG
jgi:ketosteroid isomerase-like protein